LHGDFFYYQRNNDWGARNPLAFKTEIVNGVATPVAYKPPDTRHQFGGTIGGPIVKNKLLFFANYEKYSDRKRYSGTYATVPTDAFRNGDFSAILTGRQLGTDQIGRPIMENAIYDPTTT
jgi:hypothetical protein